jgi:hypothetical protein
MKKVMSMLVLACGLVGTTAGESQATFYRRQYYSSWSYHTTYRYYYRSYYYQPAPTYTTYRYHYVVYYPTQPSYVYYYNPYRQTYWGRSPAKSGGKEMYSLLAEEHRKGRLADIKEEYFPKPGPMPSVPESTDKVKMEVPPDDTPEAK